MDRRAFFRAGLLGGIALAAASAVPLWRGRREPRRARRDGLAVFSAEEAGILSVIAARIISPLDPAQLRVAERIDALLVGCDALTQRDLKRLLRLFGGRLGAVLEGRWAPFTERSVEAQEASLRDWRDSRLPLRRSGFQALQRLCLAVTYSNPASYEGIAYPGPPLVQRPDGTAVGGTTGATP